MIVTQAPSGSSVRPGDRIMALEGASNADWLARLTRNISSDTPALAYSQMQGMELYYIWLEYGPLSRFTLALEDAAASDVRSSSTPFPWRRCLTARALSALICPAATPAC
ncbi:MAG: hypothetical protein JKP95_00390 [Oceanicaulis sp.]|nr:hypothetical protein [Oceanicaulis sp.]